MKEITIAIGDIHGCLNELISLINKVEKYCRVNEYIPKFIFLGDYIDRGPESKAVLDFLMLFQSNYECVFLQGNHDAWMIKTRLGESGWGGWLDWGGRETLASFGVTRVQDIPQKYIDWIYNLPTWYEDEAHYYVHAGLLSGKLPSQVGTDTLLWIRDGFLESEYDWGKMVIHGHTISHGVPDCYFNRICIDTGCFQGGGLTAAIIDSELKDPLTFISVTSKMYWNHR